MCSCVVLLSCLNLHYCVWGRRGTQPLIFVYSLFSLVFVACSVHYWVSCAIKKRVFLRLHLFRHTFTSFWDTCSFLPHFDALSHVVIHVSSALFQTFAEVKHLSTKILLWIKFSCFSGWFVTVYRNCVRLQKMVHVSNRVVELGGRCATK